MLGEYMAIDIGIQIALNTVMLKVIEYVNMKNILRINYNENKLYFKLY